LAVWAGPSAVRAEPPTDASSSRAARKEAQAALPFAELDPEEQQIVRRVLRNVTIFRRMPTRVLACDPELHHFLVNQPDVLVNVWERLAAGHLPAGVHLVHLEQQSPDLYRANDGHGTQGFVRYLHRTSDSLLIYADGVYEGPVFMHRVEGRCLLLLRSGYFRDLDGRAYVTCRLDAFIQLDQAGAQVVAKTFQPLVGKVADQSFVEGTAFLEALSRITVANPSGAQRLVNRLENLSPATRDRFTEVSLRARERVRARTLSTPERGMAVATDGVRTARAQSD
jgi:hypothetical protein